MSPLLPDPGPTTDVRATFLRYLDFYREVVVDKVSGLSDDDLRASRLPSGWSPVELVKHLVFMERRWFVWGFLGEAVDEPFGDAFDDRWYVAPSETLESLVERLRAGGRRTREIVEAAELTDVAPDGPRFEGRPPATLQAILFHVLQEYARHAGHLDVARELVDGSTGEDDAAR
ncbi:DinB family protein [Angustibacter peucedani]